MIDWHCHLLPGIDDGPATVEESVEMARYLVHEGYHAVCCTPHLIKGSFEAGNSQVLATLAVLRQELLARKIDLKLLPGREYYLDEFLPEYLKNPLPIGETHFLLLEIPNFAPTALVRQSCYEIKGSGYTPMIAHPERCIHFAASEEHPISTIRKKWNAFRGKINGSATSFETEDVPLPTYLSDIGCLFQGNLGSFVGQYGEKVRRSAELLDQAGVYTHFGTDLHAVPADKIFKIPVKTGFSQKQSL